MEHTNATLLDCLTMPISFIKDYKTSTAFKYRKKALQNEVLYKEQLIKRMDMMIKGLYR
ncbi:hypothetical protein [Faucicola boevrei]|uniref:hypothetical protein n=1 Tax=Faucicola boevrei TaxID=346665 RepID=UPI000367BD58|nr:hypothetical protein [Moraxella boevrei]